MWILEYERAVKEVRKRIKTDRKKWAEMAEAGIASYRYFRKLADNEIAEPSPRKVARIQQWLATEKAA